MSDVLKSVFQVNNKKNNTASDPRPINAPTKKSTTLAEDDIDWTLSARVTARNVSQEKF